MASIYTKSLQIHNAEQFKASIGDASLPYVYLTFSKVDAWSSESAPPQANNSVETFNQAWKNMIGAKKIVGNDVRLAIRRYDWVSGTVYTTYDDSEATLDMNDPATNFYVITDQWNVYKCLGNNNGAPSTFKPTSINTYIAEQLADKYIWKYMYTLTDEEKLRFTTTSFIPVRTLTEDNGSLQWQVQQNAVQGAIGSFEIVNGGSGYSVASPPVITITGDGIGAEASASVNATTLAVESILVTNKGQNYTYANVSFSSATGGGAIARVITSPPGGHGSDPVEELGASFVIINPQLRGSESGVLDTQNEFRQISLIKNPVLNDGITLASGLVYSQTTSISTEDVGDNYQEDEYVFQGTSLATATFKGRVVSWNSATFLLQLIDVSGILNSDALIGDISKASRLPKVNSVINRSFTPYTGNLLYINNITPIQRATDQTEDFKIVVSF
jgi:hypothetical protein